MHHLTKTFKPQRVKINGIDLLALVKYFLEKNWILAFMLMPHDTDHMPKCLDLFYYAPLLGLKDVTDLCLCRCMLPFFTLL